jgi:hypothetical protein
MKILKDLLEMGEYEEEVDKKYVDEQEAKEHAKEFLDRASQVLNYNKKEGGDSEIEKLACQYAKDYYEEICDAIKGKRYEGRDGGSEKDSDREMNGEMDRGDEDFM